MLDAYARASCRSTEHIDAVCESVAKDPRMPIPHYSKQLGITTWRILRKNLALHACKIQLTREIKPSNCRQHRTCVDWVFKNKAVDNDFWKKIIFSNEVHLRLNGYVNKKNCRIWGIENVK